MTVKDLIVDNIYLITLTNNVQFVGFYLGKSTNNICYKFYKRSQTNMDLFKTDYHLKDTVFRVGKFTTV